MIKKMLKKRIHAGVLAVLRHWKGCQMVRAEARVLKEKNPVQKPTGVRRHNLSPRYKGQLKTMSALCSLAGVIEYDKFVSSAGGSRRTETIRACLCLAVVGLSEFNLPLFC